MTAYNTLWLKTGTALTVGFLLCLSIFLALPVRAQETTPGEPPINGVVATDSTPPNTATTTSTSSVGSGPADTPPASTGDPRGGRGVSPPPGGTGTTTDPGAGTPPPVIELQNTVATSTDGTGSKIGGTIFTGDALASTTAKNELNTNTTNAVDGPGKTNSSILTNENINFAELMTDDLTKSATGENVANGGVGLATVVSGNAVATANVINVVNTNIFNSEGLVLFLNELFGDGLDLRTFDLSYFFNAGAGASPTNQGCTLLTCLNSSALNVLNTNTATVTNSVLVRAATGENVASSTGPGGALIETGDAFAAANVLNLVNTNLISSSYLLLSFNNFGDLHDDITLPDANFFSSLLARGGALPSLSLNSSSYGAHNTNFTDFTGTTTANGMTGDNTASTTGEGHGEITTGNAFTSASSFTEANTTDIGGSSVFMLFRVWGNWTGSIQGLPRGISWRETEYGIELISDPRAENPPAETLGVFNSSSFLASSTNQAEVKTDVNVWALTGENHAMTENGTSTIKTGDAFAAANVVNLINTNIIGRNWIFAIFNIFGDWSGNIGFGAVSKPDLWVGVIAETTNPTLANTDVVYHFTVANHGDTDAHQVVLKADYDKNLLTFAQEGGRVDTQTGSSWNLGTIPRGRTLDWSFTAHAARIPDGTSASVPLVAKVSSDRTDNNLSDNTEEVVIVISAPGGEGGGGGGGGVIGGGGGGSSSSGGGGGGGGGGSPAGPSPSPSTQTSQGSTGGGGGGGGAGFSTPTGGSGLWSPDPYVSITKTVAVASSTLPANVDYKVVITNSKNAGPAFKAILTDTLYDPTGKILYERAWNLDTLAPGDEITLTYTVAYAATSTPGLYKNVARVTGERRNTSSSYAVAMMPVEAVGVVELNAGGLVLGVSVATSAPVASSCEPLLINYLRPGSGNRTEVMKLQAFLAKDPTVYPRGLVTGYFGSLTTAGVKAFQQKYASEVLAPLNIKVPTGLVYSSTIDKINQLACAGEAPLAVAVTPPPPPPALGTPVPVIEKPQVPKAPSKPKKPSKPMILKPANWGLNQLLNSLPPLP